jgi:hypothetical protein
MVGTTAVYGPGALTFGRATEKLGWGGIGTHGDVVATRNQTGRLCGWRI